MVAHRLSTVEKVGRIYAVKEASVIVQGTFKELLETSEYFQKLWKSSQVAE